MQPDSGAATAGPAPAQPAAGRIGTPAHDALPILAGAAVLLAWDASAADLVLMRHIGTPGGFAWQSHWLTAGMLHGAGRALSLLLLLALVVHLFRPLPPARRMPRGVRLWLLLATLGALLLVPYVKSRSGISCPWDLAEFGGPAHSVSHWSAAAWLGPGDGGPGRCFPSGHASGAFAFVTGWFALRAVSPATARRWLGWIVLFGVLNGALQVLRGAHAPSHVAWSAWLCWTFAAVAWHAARPGPRWPAPAARS